MKEGDLLEGQGQTFTVKLLGRHRIQEVTCRTKGTVLQRERHITGSDSNVVVEVVLLLLLLYGFLLLYQAFQKQASSL